MDESPPTHAQSGALTAVRITALGYNSVAQARERPAACNLCADHVRQVEVAHREGLAGFTVVAERLSADGHRGFVLAPGPRSQPDWPVLEAGAQRSLP